MKKIIIVISLLLIFNVSAVSAEYLSINGSLSDIDTIYSASKSLTTNSLGDSDLENKLIFSGRLRGLGRFRAYFDLKKNFKFTGKSLDALFLQGEIVFRSSSIVLATARIEQVKDGYKIHIEILDEGELRKIRRSFRLVKFSFETNLDKGIINKRLWRGKKYDKIERSCGTAHSHGAHRKLKKTKYVPSNTLKQVSLIVEGDTELQNKGKNLSNYLPTMMNMVDNWYKRDLGVSFATTIVSTATNYNSSVEYDEDTYKYYLHNEMRTKRPATSRLEHIHYLVTGKKPTGNSNGLAGVVPALGTICRRKSNSIGFTIHYSDSENFNYETTAHEIGHLFDAEHDDATTGNVGYMMNSGTNYVSEYLSEFSNLSKNQVASHLETYNSCINNSDGGSDDEEDSNPDDNDNVEEITYSVTIKHNQRLRRWRRRVGGIRVIVRRSDGLRRVGRMLFQINCGYNSDNISEPLKSARYTNRRGRRGLRFRKRKTPGFCQAFLLDENYQALAVSNILSDVGSKQPPQEDEWDDDEWWDDL